MIFHFRLIPPNSKHKVPLLNGLLLRLRRGLSRLLILMSPRDLFKNRKPKTQFSSLTSTWVKENQLELSYTKEKTTTKSSTSSARSTIWTRRRLESSGMWFKPNWAKCYQRSMKNHMLPHKAKKSNQVQTNALEIRCFDLLLGSYLSKNKMSNI